MGDYALFMFVFLERNGAVEDKMFWRRLRVNVIIACASELQVGEYWKRLYEFLYKGLLVHADAIRIEEGAHGFDTANTIFFFVLLDGITRILACPKARIVAHLSGQAVVAAQPVNGALNFAVGTFSTRLRSRIISAVDLLYFTSFLVLFAASAVYNIGTLEASFLAHSHAEEFLRDSW